MSRLGGFGVSTYNMSVPVAENTRDRAVAELLETLRRNTALQHDSAERAKDRKAQEDAQKKAKKEARKQQLTQMGIGLGAGIAGGAVLGAALAPAAMAGSGAGGASAGTVTSAGTAAGLSSTTGLSSGAATAMGTAGVGAGTAAGTGAAASIPIGAMFGGAIPAGLGAAGGGVLSGAGTGALAGGLIGAGLGGLSALSGQDYLGTYLNQTGQRRYQDARLGLDTARLGLDAASTAANVRQSDASAELSRRRAKNIDEMLPYEQRSLNALAQQRKASGLDRLLPDGRSGSGSDPYTSKDIETQLDARFGDMRGPQSLEALAFEIGNMGADVVAMEGFGAESGRRAAAWTTRKLRELGIEDPDAYPFIQTVTPLSEGPDGGSKWDYNPKWLERRNKLKAGQWTPQ